MNEDVMPSFDLQAIQSRMDRNPIHAPEPVRLKTEDEANRLKRKEFDLNVGNEAIIRLKGLFT